MPTGSPGVPGAAAPRRAEPVPGPVPGPVPPQSTTGSPCARGPTPTRRWRWDATRIRAQVNRFTIKESTILYYYTANPRTAVWNPWTVWTPCYVDFGFRWRNRTRECWDPNISEVIADGACAGNPTNKEGNCPCPNCRVRRIL